MTVQSSSTAGEGRAQRTAIHLLRVVDAPYPQSLVFCRPATVADPQGGVLEEVKVDQGGRYDDDGYVPTFTSPTLYALCGARSGGMKVDQGGRYDDDGYVPTFTSPTLYALCGARFSGRGARFSGREARFGDSRLPRVLQSSPPPASGGERTLMPLEGGVNRRDDRIKLFVPENLNCKAPPVKPVRLTGQTGDWHYSAGGTSQTVALHQLDR
jgi:hypothetical protein